MTVTPQGGAACVVGGGRTAEQSNTTANRAEHCDVMHSVQLPVMRVFQSVSLSLNRQVVEPPFEIFVQGLFVPGKWATTQSAGIGMRQLWRFSFFAMPKLQVVSVVADEPPRGCAKARFSASTATAPADTTVHIFIGSFQLLQRSDRILAYRFPRFDGPAEPTIRRVFRAARKLSARSSASIFMSC